MENCIFGINFCKDESCNYCYKKSFASHEKSKYLLNENPRHYTKGSSKKLEFKCNVCSHSFVSSLNHITSSSRWCPYCVNQKLCGLEECDNCYKKSFLSHPKSKYLLIKLI